MALASALVLLSLLVILIAAELFTNAVEWLGLRLHLGQGAVGSVLAAVGTALPETMIPIIAIIAVGDAEAQEIGIGAILGAPFLLSTAAFSVTGLAVLYFQGRRASGTRLTIDPVIIRRDLGFFFLVYLMAIVASFLPSGAPKELVALPLIGLYIFYVYRTIKASDAALDAADEGLAPLRLHSLLAAIGGIFRPGDAATRAAPAEAHHEPQSAPPLLLVGVQFFGALGLIVAAAQLFVKNLEHISDDLHVPALLLALVIAPLATELPEKFNSVLWIRRNKDTLAMGNISGAMVFQSCIPVSVGVVFTSWELTEAALVSAVIALASTGIVYVSLVHAGHISAVVLARAGVFWVGFVAYVIVKLVV